LRPQRGAKVGAGGRGRTHTSSRIPDFESGASANSATPAQLVFSGSQRHFNRFKVPFIFAKRKQQKHYGRTNVVGKLIRVSIELQQCLQNDAAAACVNWSEKICLGRDCRAK
jgi:hypothetical protein